MWQAYKRLQASLVRGAPSDKVLTDIISLVRFATGQADVLEPYAARVEQRFNLWIGRQKKAGRDFNEEQMNWLQGDQGLSGGERGDRAGGPDAGPAVHAIGAAWWRRGGCSGRS